MVCTFNKMQLVYLVKYTCIYNNKIQTHFVKAGQPLPINASNKNIMQQLLKIKINKMCFAYPNLTVLEFLLVKPQPHMNGMEVWWVMYTLMTMPKKGMTFGKESDKSSEEHHHCSP